MSLDFWGAVLVSASMVVVINGLIGGLDVSRAARLVLATLAGLWVGLQVALASSGLLGLELAGRVPLLGLMVLTPSLAVAIAAIVSPAVRTALLHLSMPLLIGLNATRIVGAFFVLLAATGRMTGPFPHIAGWGDIATAVLAVPLALGVARKTAGPAAVVGWSILGTADLVLAVTLGTISFNGGGAGLIPAASGGAEIEGLPWSLIPTVLVPVLLIMHGIIFAQLLAGRSRRAALAGA